MFSSISRHKNKQKRYIQTDIHTLHHYIYIIIIVIIIVITMVIIVVITTR